MLTEALITTIKMKMIMMKMLMKIEWMLVEIMIMTHKQKKLSALATKWLDMNFYYVYLMLFYEWKIISDIGLCPKEYNFSLFVSKCLPPKLKKHVIFTNSLTFGNIKKYSEIFFLSVNSKHNAQGVDIWRKDTHHNPWAEWEGFLRNKWSIQIFCQGQN